MRHVLWCIMLTGCVEPPSEAVISKRQALVCAQPIKCEIRADSAVIWVNGMKYLEIVEHCD